MSEKARIRRGTAPRGTSTRRRPPTVTQQRRGVAAPRGAVALPSRALMTLPALPMDAMKRWGRRGAWCLAAAGAVSLAFFLQLPQMAGLAAGEAIGAMGLSVKRVEISGLKHMERLPVYAVALDQQTTAMPLVDIEAIRQKLLKFGWVADARVSRRLPDTLLVDVVEREPVAIWQYRQKLNLIDREGRVLAPVDLANMPDLPVLVGPDANMREGQLAGLLEAAPQLKPMIAGASWIGGRRWDLRFQSGETLALPEGEGLAKTALTKFQRLDQVEPLLGRGFVRFDMRVPGKFVVRVSKEPGSVAAPIPKPDPAPAPTANNAPTAPPTPAAPPPADVI